MPLPKEPPSPQDFQPPSVSCDDVRSVLAKLEAYREVRDLVGAAESDERFSQGWHAALKAVEKLLGL